MATHKQETEHLAKLMKKIDIAMLVTVGPRGYLVSRPLSTQCATFDGERIWFLTEADSPKVAEIRKHPKINVSYASKDANTYVSVAGDGRISRDRALIDQFWNDAMKAFFPNGKDDPNLVLIEVQVRTIEYWDGPSSLIGKALTFAIARVTGNDEVMGENRIVDVKADRSRKPTGTRRPARSTAKSTAKRKPAKKSAPQAANKSTGAATGRKTVKKASAAGAGKATRKVPARKKTAKKAPARKR